MRREKTDPQTSFDQTGEKSFTFVTFLHLIQNTPQVLTHLSPHTSPSSPPPLTPSHGCNVLGMTFQMPVQLTVNYFRDATVYLCGLSVLNFRSGNCFCPDYLGLACRIHNFIRRSNMPDIPFCFFDRRPNFLPSDAGVETTTPNGQHGNVFVGDDQDMENVRASIWDWIVTHRIR
ncbi:hypothetical protein RHMOL_Rhmol06G0259100 [Rhododendron molle]|uniref:Uncharacterized protein n=1 Tax=Rhododendron molle TaxID=49168 RepID=A0ACC0NIB8_RHOML|nr:hypothetical protein RHMOL_Rhmol06G0259100 [Rhododendron molle]